jgi:hypothetical protein
MPYYDMAATDGVKDAMEPRAFEHWALGRCISLGWEGWPAPGLDDTQLSESSLPLELHRTQITDRRVPAF